ncbi:MAG TPA: hypothetical protein VHL58_05220, partial [Thermoanaerobaculia bacterium]|nr:hypothetical protein [Thermoanaerobaculia bacterium]
AFVADAPMFRVLDITRPTNPRQIAAIYIGDFSDRVQLRDTTAIVYGRGSVHLIDISSPLAPRQTGVYRSLGIPRSGAAWAGSYLLEANRATGFHVLDVTDPTHPVQTTGLRNDSHGGPTGVLTAVPTAVYIGVSDGIKIADLADPHHTVVTATGIGGGFTDAQIVQSTSAHPALLALPGLESLRLFDLTTPAMPVEISSILLPPGGAESVAGDLLYITNPRGELYVVSVANAAQPQIVFAGNGLNSPTQTSAAGGLLAIADTYSLKIYTDPATGGSCSDAAANTTAASGSPAPAPPTTRATEPADGSSRTAGARLLIPGVGAVLGGNGTHWESDLRILCKRDCAMSLDYIPFGVNAAAKRVLLTAKKGELIVAPDVVRNLFATDDTNGMLELRSNALDDISASATTLNRGGAGSYGERIPARRLQPSVAGNSRQLLPGIRQNAAARTNIGIVETTGQRHSASLELLDDEGSVVTSRNLELEGFQSFQASLPSLFPDLQNDFSGTLRIDGIDSTVAYASRVDQKTGDFVFTYAQHFGEVSAISGDDSIRFLPAAGSTPGANNSVWRTALQLTNVSSSPATFLLTYIPSVDPAAAVTRRVELNSFASADTDDFLDSYFPSLPAGLMTSGSLRIESAAPFIGWSRIYNQSANGTFGQAVPLLDRSPARTAGASRNQEKRARLTDETTPISFAQVFSLSENSVHRTNLGLLETAGKEADVTIRFFDIKGMLLRSTDRHVPAGASLPLIGILRTVGLQGAGEVRAEIEQTSGEGSVILFGSVVDQVTGDGVFATAD